MLASWGLPGGCPEGQARAGPGVLAQLGTVSVVLIKVLWGRLWRAKRGTEDSPRRRHLGGTVSLSQWHRAGTRRSFMGTLVCSWKRAGFW